MIDESVILASLAASPVVFPYSYLLGGWHSALASILTCFLTVPCCAFMSISLRGCKDIPPLPRYSLLLPVCLPLAYALSPSSIGTGSFPIRWDFPSLLVIVFATLLGISSMLSASTAPLKVPAVCVSTRRRVAHTVSSQLLFILSPSVLVARISSLLFLFCMAIIITVPLSTNVSSLSVFGLARDLVFVVISTVAFYDTCLATTRLFSSLPPLRLNGRTICSELAAKKRVAYWESSLFVGSGRTSREWVWAITPNGRELNWQPMVGPALDCLRTATHQIERRAGPGNMAGMAMKKQPASSNRLFSDVVDHNRRHGTQFISGVPLTSWRKPQTVQLDDMEQVLWSLDTVGTLVYYAYNENKNGVTQVHFREVMDVLFALDGAVAHVGGPPVLHDRLHNTMYKICTRYASAVHALDMDQKYHDRFMNYSDFKV